MNILLDELPEKVTINSTEYAINSDFRTVIKAEILIEKEPKDLIKQVLQLFFPVLPHNAEQAVEKFIWFYRCGQCSGSSGSSGSSGQKAYSFEYDGNYIYSAFFQQYGIDLAKENLHWWQFKALFNSLSEDCLFTKIMQYRTAEITSDMPKKEKERIRKLKRIYALPLSENEQKRQNEIENALMNGGDISRFL